MAVMITVMKRIYQDHLDGTERGSAMAQNATTTSNAAGANKTKLAPCRLATKNPNTTPEKATAAAQTMTPAVACRSEGGSIIELMLPATSDYAGYDR